VVDESQIHLLLNSISW